MAQQNTDILDGLQEAVITEAKKANGKSKSKYSFDPLAMYFREDYEIAGIKIKQPTIGDILSIGESNIYSGLSPFLYNSTSIRVMLWDAGVDWCKVSDIEVFAMLTHAMREQKSDFKAFHLLFPDVNMSDYEYIKVDDQSNEFYGKNLYNFKTDKIIRENEYIEIAEYIRTLFNIHPKVEKAKGKTTKKWMIDEDKMNMAQRGDKDSSTLLPLISACINHPGFKYKLQELRQVGIYEFMDSVQRLQIYESTHALMGGMYSEMRDLSNVPKEQFNFMREINE